MCSRLAWITVNLPKHVFPHMIPCSSGYDSPPPSPASRLHIWVMDLVSRSDNIMTASWKLWSLSSFLLVPVAPWPLPSKHSRALCTNTLPQMGLSNPSHAPPGTVLMPQVSKSHASKTLQLFVILMTCSVSFGVSNLCVFTGFRLFKSWELVMHL